MYSRILGLTSLIVLVTLSTTIYPGYTYGFTVQYVDVYLYKDGSVKIQYYIFTDPLENISIPLPREPFYIEIYGGLGPVTYEYRGGVVTFISPFEEVIVDLYFNDLTGKEGGIWFFEVNIEYPYTVILPERVVLLDISREDYQLTFRNNSLAILLGGGYVRIEYVLPPSTPAGDESPPQGGSGDVFMPSLELISLGLIMVLAAVSTYLYIRRRKGGDQDILDEILDERDDAILKALERRPMTAQELIEFTGIPKSPLYRRLSKLEKMGFVEKARLGGKRVYRLRR